MIQIHPGSKVWIIVTTTEESDQPTITNKFWKLWCLC